MFKKVTLITVFILVVATSLPIFGMQRPVMPVNFAMEEIPNAVRVGRAMVENMPPERFGEFVNEFGLMGRRIFGGYASLTGEVIKLLRLFPELDIHAVTDDGMTPLHWAARYGYARMVDYLLDAGVDMYVAENALGWTALHMAAHNGHSKVAQSLLTQDPNAIHTPDYEGRTPLMIAVASRHDQFIDAAVRVPGVTITGTDHCGSTGLHWAVSNGEGMGSIIDGVHDIQTGLSNEKDK